MRFFYYTALLTCKRMLRRPGMFLMTLILPIICAAAGLYFSRGGDVIQIRVGIAVEENDSFGAAIYEGLERFDGPIVFELHSLENIAFLEREVASGRMDSAYIISPELKSNLYRGRARGGIEVLTSPQTFVDILAGEMIAASMLREIAPQMNIELLVEVLRISEYEAIAIIAQKYAYYDAHPEIFMEPVFFYMDGARAGAETPVSAGGRILHGVIALYLLAGVIWSLPALIRETPGILRRLPPSSARAFMLGTGAAILLIGLGQGVLGLIALSITYPPALAGIPAAMIPLIGYMTALSLAATTAALAIRQQAVIYAGGSFLLLLTAALGDVFLTLGEISPQLGRISAFFPSRYYIGGVMGGSSDAIFYLILFSVAFGFLTIALSARRGRV